MEDILVDIFRRIYRRDGEYLFKEGVKVKFLGDLNLRQQTCTRLDLRLDGGGDI